MAWGLTQEEEPNTRSSNCADKKQDDASQYQLQSAWCVWRDGRRGVHWHGCLCRYCSVVPSWRGWLDSAQHVFGKIRYAVLILVHVSHCLLISCSRIRRQFFDAFVFLPVHNNFCIGGWDLCWWCTFKYVGYTIPILIFEDVDAFKLIGKSVSILVLELFHGLLIFRAYIGRHLIHTVICFTVYDNKVWSHNQLHY